MHINPIHDIPPPAVLPLPDYATAEQIAWQTNATEAYRNSALVSAQRIATYVSRFGGTPAAIRAKISGDAMFAATFAKNPVNAGFEKTVALDWLRANLNVQIVDPLSSNRDNAWFVTATGEIRRLRAGEEKPSKALNFRWVMGGITYYALHKYTPSSGGSQGRQFNEERRILTNFQQATDPNKVLIVIVDGDYYTDTRYINQRIGVLRNLANGNTPKSFAVHMQHVPWAVAQCP